MQLRWIGAVLVIVGCGAFGFKMAQEYLREIYTLRQLNAMLEYMENELRFRLTPLPDLIIQAAQQAKGALRLLFTDLAALLECNSNIDATGCMDSVLQKYPKIPKRTAAVLTQLGASMGVFDLDGQLTGLESAKFSCSGELKVLEQEKTQHVRNYQILGLCAGAALAILLL